MPEVCQAGGVPPKSGFPETLVPSPKFHVMVLAPPFIENEAKLQEEEQVKICTAALFLSPSILFGNPIPDTFKPVPTVMLFAEKPMLVHPIALGLLIMSIVLDPLLDFKIRPLVVN